MAGIHNSQARMPAILPRDARESWLFGNLKAPARRSLHTPLIG